MGEAFRLKVYEPILILGTDKFSNLDIRVRVKGGGTIAQIYAIRAAIAKSIVAYHSKYVDEASKNEIRQKLLNYDRNLLVSDPRRCSQRNMVEGVPGRDFKRVIVSNREKANNV